MDDSPLEIESGEERNVKIRIVPEKHTLVLRVREGDSSRFRQKTLMLKDPELKTKAHDFIAIQRASAGAVGEAMTIRNAANTAMANSQLVLLEHEFPVTELEDLPVSIGENKYMASSFLILGQSRMSGKTKLLTQMHKQWFKKKKWTVVIFAANLQNPLYEKFKGALKFDCFHEEILERLRAIQRGTDNAYNFVIILDDIVSTKHKQFLNEAVLTYRNSNIYIIISTQYYGLIAPSARTNFTWMFLGKFSRPEAIEKMSKGVLMDFPGKRPEDKWRNYAYLTRTDHDEEEEEWTNRWIVDSADGQRFSVPVKA